MFVCRKESFASQTRNYGGRNGAQPPGKMCWRWFEIIGYSLKILGRSQKTLRPLVSQVGCGPVPSNESDTEIFQKKIKIFMWKSLKISARF